jgi:dihydroflavonol-4-reductase
MVLPGQMLGPGDLGPTPTGKLVLDFLAAKLPGVVSTTFSVVDARDVASAMIAAADGGRRGERYLVAGRDLSMAEFLQTLEQVSGVKAPTRRVPTTVLFVVAALSEIRARLSGQPAAVSLETARLLANQRDRTHFDSSKSQRELGIGFRPLEETVRDTIAWYQDHGWLDEQQSARSAAAIG